MLSAARVTIPVQDIDMQCNLKGKSLPRIMVYKLCMCMTVKGTSGGINLENGPSHYRKATFRIE